mmetsp:Transcript_48336/g.82553  ORF Transcript_48336/g.82553 Transcript_48336/m.82553 type:complete len:164 (+) Transcript_48336:168-659(+)
MLHRQSPISSSISKPQKNLTRQELSSSSDTRFGIAWGASPVDNDLVKESIMPTRDIMMKNTNPALMAMTKLERDELLNTRKKTQKSSNGGDFYMTSTTHNDFRAPVANLPGASAYEEALRASREFRDKTKQGQRGGELNNWSTRQARWNQAPSGYGGTWLHNK